ncbi:Com family DNA-binding transcriptional regulator [Chromobacterium haemolyticum]|nr:Com family DNA-binding transcriptional regulator [Chromobacterium haemolyticum]
MAIELRCKNCSRKLAEGIYTYLSIKCPRCKKINTWRA